MVIQPATGRLGSPSESRALYFFYYLTNPDTQTCSSLLRGHIEELGGVESVAPVAATAVEAAGDENLSIPEQGSRMGCAAARQSRNRHPLFEVAVEKLPPHPQRSRPSVLRRLALGRSEAW